MDGPDITQEIVDQAREAAVADGARRIAGLRLAITAAAGLGEDSIVDQFEQLTHGDELFRGATLRFEHKPVAATCLSCSDEFSTDAPQPICPQCGSQTVRLDPEAPTVQLIEVDIEGREEGGGA